MLQKNYVTGKNKKNSIDVIAFIPARSGSKSIKDKNIKLLNGKPLIAWSIESCKKSKYIKKIIVSTDSKKYAKIALKYGATHIVQRPKNISGDKSTDYQALMHAIKYLKFLNFKFIAHIRPTTPIRNVREIDRAISLFSKKNFTSLRSVHEMPESAYKTFEISKKNLLKPICRKKNSIDYFSRPRQNFRKTFSANGLIDIYKRKHLIDKKNLYGKKVFAFKTKFTHEIDSFEQFKYLNSILKKK
jgi:CMP-N,N'-diacetyllegionaminic acid synthase